MIPQAIIRGSWVQVRAFPALVSHLATGGTIGTQEGLIPSHAGVSGPEYPTNSKKYHSWKMAAGIGPLVKPDLFYNTLSSIHQPFGSP